MPSNLDLGGARDCLPAGAVLFHDTGECRLRVFVGPNRQSTGCRLSKMTTLSSGLKYLVEWAWRLTAKNSRQPAPFDM